MDSSGNVYVIGSTGSTDFPTTPGAFQTTISPNYDVFVTKLNPTGSALVYSTYLGGMNSEFGLGVAVDSSGDAYVTGVTFSTDFPTTPGAFQTTHGCSGIDFCFDTQDAFVTKLNPTGSALVYSTYLGGSGFDWGYAIGVDPSGDAYVTGNTVSFYSPNDFPTTSGGFGAGLDDAFVTKLNPAGSALVFSIYLGGSSNDRGLGIAVDSSGNAYVTGYAGSTDFPTTPGAFQTTFSGVWSFVAKISLPASAGELINNLIALVQSFDLAHGTANSLDVKLQAAQNALAALKANDDRTACNQIGAFIAEVQAQSGNKLTVDQANQLIAHVNIITTNLGCQ